MCRFATSESRFFRQTHHYFFLVRIVRRMRTAPALLMGVNPLCQRVTVCLVTPSNAAALTLVSPAASIRSRNSVGVMYAFRGRAGMVTGKIRPSAVCLQ